MNHRSSAWLMAGILTTVFAACAAPPDDPKPIAVSTSISAEELAEQIQRSQAPLILDVRTEAEYARVRIPGSLNIPIDELSGRLSEIDVAKTDEIVVHCYSGYRAKKAEAILLQAGFLNVRDLDGHMEGWKRGDYPIEKN
jgi:rhodanese-related sulfurtransferase